MQKWQIMPTKAKPKRSKAVMLVMGEGGDILPLTPMAEIYLIEHDTFYPTSRKVAQAVWLEKIYAWIWANPFQDLHAPPPQEGFGRAAHPSVAPPRRAEYKASLCLFLPQCWDLLQRQWGVAQYHFSARGTRCTTQSPAQTDMNQITYLLLPLCPN